MPGQNTTTRPALRPLSQLWAGDVGDYVADLAWSPDGKHLACAAANGIVSCFNAEDGTTVKTWTAHRLGALTAKWSFDGAFLATAGQDGQCSIFDGRALTLLSELKHGSQWVEHLAWNARQNVLLTAAGKTPRLWQGDGELIAEFPSQESTITGMKWNPGTADQFATACYGGVRLWHRDEREPKRHLKWKGSLLNLEYSPSGKVITCGCQDGAVHFWMLPGGKDLEMSGYPTKVRELAWDHQSRYLATGGSEQVCVWDFAGKGPQGSTPLMLTGHESYISQLAFQPQGTFLASGGLDGRIFVWGPPPRKKPLASAELDSEVSKLAWNADGTLLASGESCGSIRLWQLD